MANFLDMSVLNEAAVKAPTLDNITVSHTHLENVSYFSQTVDFLIEYNHEFTEATKTLYKGISESGDNQELINESFADFGNAIKKIIDKFLAFLKSLFQRFITNLNSMFKAEGYLKKHEADFKKFSEQHNFTFSGYNFTIDSSIPITNVVSEWLGNLDVQYNDTSKYDNIFKVADDAQKMEVARKQLEEDLKTKYKAITDYLSGSYYDEKRAEILGKTGKIYDSEYANECFAVFRNDTSDKEELDITSSYITSCYARFKNYNKTRESIEKKKKEIEKEYKEMNKELETMVKSDGYGNSLTITLGPTTTSHLQGSYGNYTFGTSINGTTTISQASQTLLTEFEKYKKAKVSQVEQLSNLHALAFAAKLDAAKDMFVQDKTILYKALYKIQGISKDNK